MKIPLQIIESLSYIIQNDPDVSIRNTLDEIDELNQCNVVTIEDIDKADRNSKIVDLSNNKLYYLPKSLSEYKELKVLKLSGNNVIDYSGIDSLNNLKYLFLDNTYSKYFPSEIFNLRNLVYIDAHNNELHYLSNQIGNFESLLYLNLENNLISFIPEQMKKCKVLKYFNLNSNRIRHINYNFNENPELVEIHFEKNQINSFDKTLTEHTKIKLLEVGNTGDKDIGNISNNNNGHQKVLNIIHNNNTNSSGFTNDNNSSVWKEVFQNYINLFSDYIKKQINQKIEIIVQEDSDGLKLLTHSDENIPFETIQKHLQDYLNDINNTSGKIKDLIDNNELKRYEIFELKQTVKEISSEKNYLQEKAEKYYEKVLLLTNSIDEHRKHIDTLKDEVQYLKENKTDELHPIEGENKNIVINIENKQINGNEYKERDGIENIKKEEKVVSKEEKQFASEFNEEIFLKDLYDKSIRMAERKYKISNEGVYNDSLADYFRDKGYFVTDQSRSGISKKDSGSVDFIIRDSNGTPVTIIEALRMKSCGKKNKVLLDHIIRLLKKYDTVGHSTAYMITYSESRNFVKLWKNYLAYIENLNENEEYNKIKCPISKIYESSYSEKADIRIGISEHIREEKNINLYHIFINMYVEPIEKEEEEVKEVEISPVGSEYRNMIDTGSIPSVKLFKEYIKYLIEISKIKNALDNSKKYFELIKDRKSLNFILLKLSSYNDIRNRELSNIVSKKESRRTLTKIGYDLLEFISDY